LVCHVVCARAPESRGGRWNTLPQNDSYKKICHTSIRHVSKQMMFRLEPTRRTAQIKPRIKTICCSSAPVNLGRYSLSSSYTQSAGLLGRGIIPSQGRYLHAEQRTHRINAHRHPCLEWDLNPRSQCSSGR
jgi:hypothetical protein